MGRGDYCFYFYFNCCLFFSFLFFLNYLNTFFVVSLLVVCGIA
jgi:hypothetical protein